MSKKRNCLLCKKEAQFSPSLTNVAIGEMFGVSKDTARRHRAHMDTDPFFNVPSDQVTSRGITRRLDDGSYEKITWKPEQSLASHEKSLQKVIDTVLALKPVTSVNDSRETVPMSKVIIPTDLQVGKVDVFGGTGELLERVSLSIAGIVEDVLRERPEEIILVDAGDIIENFQNTSSQAQTNDRDLTEQIYTASAIFTMIVKALSPLCKRLVYASVPSNHCTVRVGPKQPASTPSNDYGLLIQQMIKDRLSENSAYDHVEFVSPRNKFEEYVAYRSPVSNTTFGFVHGHQVSKANALGQWLTNIASHPKSPMRDVEILVAGHFHSFHLYEDRGRWVMVGTSSDGGSSWFTNISGQQSAAGITCFNAIGGRWFSPNIY